MKTVITEPTQRLTCCCCGDETIGRHWWNRDTGFGICRKCADWQQVQDYARSYGYRGIHFDVEELPRKEL